MKYNNYGRCPYCNSENLTYDVIDLEDEMAYFPVTCDDCNRSFKEWYHLEYIEMTGDDEI